LRISGSRSLAAFFVELGALMIVASTIVPVATFQAARSEMPMDPLEQLSPKIVAFQQVSELADCGLVRHRLPPQIDVAGRAHAPRSGITRCRTPVRAQRQGDRALSFPNYRQFRTAKGSAGEPVCWLHVGIKNLVQDQVAVEPPTGCGRNAESDLQHQSRLPTRHLPHVESKRVLSEPKAGLATYFQEIFLSVQSENRRRVMANNGCELVPQPSPAVRSPHIGVRPVHGTHIGQVEEELKSPPVV
jgi:hypothetical protein